MWVGSDSRGGGSSVECFSSERWGRGCTTDSLKDKTCSGLCSLLKKKKCRSVGESVGGKVQRQSTCSVGSLFSACSGI